MSSEEPLILWILGSASADYLQQSSWPSSFPFSRVSSIVVGDTAECFSPSAAPHSPHVVLLSLFPGLAALFEALWPRISPSCRWVHSLSAGLDHGVLHSALRASPVLLTNAKAVFGPSLGEYCVAACLYFAKSMDLLRQHQRARQWRPFAVRTLHGATLGVLGLGGIGTEAAWRATAMGMKVIGLKRHPPASIPSSAEQQKDIEIVYGREGLERVLQESDYLLIATPLTEETRGMVGASELALMRRDAVLINVGRGAVVDEGALAEALQEGRLRGAALDVFAVEPLPQEHAFWGMDNVLLSPHNADRTADFVHQSFAKFTANLLLFIDNKPLDNVVDKALGY